MPAKTFDYYQRKPVLPLAKGISTEYRTGYEPRHTRRAQQVRWEDVPDNLFLLEFYYEEDSCFIIKERRGFKEALRTTTRGY